MYGSAVLGQMADMSVSRIGRTGKYKVDHLLELFVRTADMPEQHSILGAAEDKVAKQDDVGAGLQFSAIERAFKRDERIAVYVFELRSNHCADLPAQLAGKQRSFKTARNLTA